MREILFRGKRIDTGEWIEGYVYRVAEKFRTTFLMVKDMHACSYEVDPETVGQYTGLKDRNGRPIFEGDIADHVYQAYPRRLFNRGVIIYDDECARFAHMLQSMNPELGRITTEAWEVIGNIHDNPELMEVRA